MPQCARGARDRDDAEHDAGLCDGVCELVVRGLGKWDHPVRLRDTGRHAQCWTSLSLQRPVRDEVLRSSARSEVRNMRRPSDGRHPVRLGPPTEPPGADPGNGPGLDAKEEGKIYSRLAALGYVE